MGRAANHAGKSGGTTHEGRALQKATAIETFVQIHVSPFLTLVALRHDPIVRWRQADS